jgi:hypothetical protein
MINWLFTPHGGAVGHVDDERFYRIKRQSEKRYVVTMRGEGFIRWFGGYKSLAAAKHRAELDFKKLMEDKGNGTIG